MVKKLIILAAVVVIMGLSLLVIQCAPGSKAPLKGVRPSGTIEQLKAPLKGFY